MLYRLRCLLSAMAALWLLAGCAKSPFTAAGNVAADVRAFPLEPKYAGQNLGLGVSLVAEPEVKWKSENEKHTLTLRPFYRLDPVDEKRSHADLRQADYKMSLEHLELAAGVGQFTWGVLESYRPVDVLNQTDFVESIDFNAKLGQPYAEAGWVTKSATFRAYYLPFFRERTFPGVRGRLRFPALIDTDSPSFESKFAQFQPSGAARFSFNAGDLDFGVSAFTGLSREPRFVAELTSGQVAPRYDLMHQASVDAQWTVGAFSFKAEGFFRLWSNDLYAFGGGGAGVDYTFFQFSGDADLSFAAEFLFDTRPRSAPITFFEHDAFAGFRLAFNDTANTEISGGAIVDVTDGSTFGRAEASRRFGEHWRVSLDGSVFAGPSGKLTSAFLRDHYARAKLAYYF